MKVYVYANFETQEIDALKTTKEIQDKWGVKESTIKAHFSLKKTDTYRKKAFIIKRFVLEKNKYTLTPEALKRIAKQKLS